ncbi:MAG: hypothetical protein IK077_05240 [Thermoguttaceae bacterium]|nr:hypothetical protein [Thermoguttaceae bacterium]
MQEISPQKRARLQQCFEAGNKQMQMGGKEGHAYATQMFAQCVCGDPANILYMNSFIVNLRQQFGQPKKKGAFGFVKAAKKNVPAGKKDFETTISEGVEKLKKDPWDAQTFVAMGMACLEEGLEEAGLAYLKHAVTSAPDDVEINRIAAVELGSRQKFDDALACWSRVDKLKPGDPEASRMISDLMLEKTIKRVNKTEHGSKMEEDEANGVAVEKLSVEDECEKRLRKNPNDRDAYKDLIDHFYGKNNMRKVEDACKRALKVFPDDDIFYPQLLEAQKARARDELARIKEQYEKAPSDALKEKFARQKKDFDEKTLALLQYNLKKSPGNSTCHFELGVFYMQHAQYKEAITEFQTAKADAGLNGQCLLSLAQCFQQIKQYRLALTHYDQAIAALPNPSEELKKALYYGARLSFGLENYDKADDYANKLAEIDFSYKDVGGLLDKIAAKRHN